MRQEYVVYRYGLPVCVGTAKICAKFINKSVSNFCTVVSNTRNGRIKSDNVYSAYVIEEGDEE